jgi:hypothetical protein
MAAENTQTRNGIVKDLLSLFKKEKKDHDKAQKENPTGIDREARTIQYKDKAYSQLHDLKLVLKTADGKSVKITGLDLLADPTLLSQVEPGKNKDQLDRLIPIIELANSDGAWPFDMTVDQLREQLLATTPDDQKVEVTAMSDEQIKAAVTEMEELIGNAGLTIESVFSIREDLAEVKAALQAPEADSEEKGKNKVTRILSRVKGWFSAGKASRSVKSLGDTLFSSGNAESGKKAGWLRLDVKLGLARKKRKESALERAREVSITTPQEAVAKIKEVSAQKPGMQSIVDIFEGIQTRSGSANYLEALFDANKVEGIKAAFNAKARTDYDEVQYAAKAKAEADGEPQYNIGAFRHEDLVKYAENQPEQVMFLVAAGVLDLHEFGHIIGAKGDVAEKGFTTQDMADMRDLVKRLKEVMANPEDRDSKRLLAELLGELSPADLTVDGLTRRGLSREQAVGLIKGIKEGKIHRHILVLMALKEGTKLATGLAGGPAVVGAVGFGVGKDMARMAGAFGDESGLKALYHAGASNLQNRDASDAERAKYQKPDAGKLSVPIHLARILGRYANAARGAGIQVGTGMTKLRSQISGDLGAIEATLASTPDTDTANADQEQAIRQLDKETLTAWVRERISSGNTGDILNLGKRLALLDKISGDYGASDVKGASGSDSVKFLGFLANRVDPRHDAAELARVHGILHTLVMEDPTLAQLPEIVQLRDKWPKLASKNAQERGKFLGSRRVLGTVVLDTLATAFSLGYEYWAPTVGGAIKAVAGEASGAAASAGRAVGIGNNENFRSATQQVGERANQARQAAAENAARLNAAQTADRMRDAYSSTREARIALKDTTLGQYDSMHEMVRDMTKSQAGAAVTENLVKSLKQNENVVWTALHPTEGHFTMLNPMQVAKLDKFAQDTFDAANQARQAGKELTPDQELVWKLNSGLNVPMSAAEQARLLEIANS